MSIRSNEERYPNGYMDKIEYWTSKLNAEVMNTRTPSLENIERINRKLTYFIQRQWSNEVSKVNPFKSLK